MGGAAKETSQRLLFSVVSWPEACLDALPKVPEAHAPSLAMKNIRGARTTLGSLGRVEWRLAKPGNV